MRRPVRLVVLAGLALVAAPGPAAEDTPPVEARRAVVVELFTSQGCSSCPPADRLLSRLGSEARADGLTLVPLAFHVDYWNRIGWVDPFSSASWSSRQRRYGERFGLRSVYTPQVVVNGRVELVGSRESALRAAIPAAVAADPAGLVEITGVTVGDAGADLVVDVVARRLEGGASPRLVANLALFESGLVTRVGAGENARRTLENDYVVRLLRPAVVLEPGQPEAVRRERLRIGLDARWSIGNLGLAAFLQDADTLEIHAAVVVQGLAESPSPST